MSVLINRAVVVNLYVQQVLRHAVVTLLSSLVIPPQALVGNLVVNMSRCFFQAGIAPEVQGLYGSPLDSTAQAILASLLANATMSTLR